METATIAVNLYDGAGNPALPRGALVTVGIGTKNVFRDYVQRENEEIKVDFQDGPENDFRVIASATDCQQSGAFVRVRPGKTSKVHLMLVGKRPAIKFRCGTFEELEKQDPKLAKLLATDRATAYEEMVRDHGEALMCLFNCLECMRRLGNKLQKSLLDQIEPGGIRLRAGKSRVGLYRDRFFAAVNEDLLSTIKNAPGDLIASEEIDPDLNFKEKRFGEANLELTFHENGRVLEVDLDYFKDRLAHLFLEVIPNFAGKNVGRKNSSTDPRIAYALRWMAAKNHHPHKLWTREECDATKCEPEEFNPLVALSLG